MEIIDKVCNVCDTKKHYLEFHKKKAAKDGLSPTCRPCTSQKTKSQRIKRGKYCHSCGDRYPLDQFHRNAQNTVDGRSATCRECIKKKYHAQNGWAEDPVDFGRIIEVLGAELTLDTTDREKIDLWNERTDLSLPRLSSKGKELSVLSA